jgi:hypothetical protein
VLQTLKSINRPSSRTLSKMFTLRFDAVLSKALNVLARDPSTHLDLDCPIGERGRQPTYQGNRLRAPRRELPRFVVIAGGADDRGRRARVPGIQHTA